VTTETKEMRGETGGGREVGERGGESERRDGKIGERGEREKARRY